MVSINICWGKNGAAELLFLLVESNQKLRCGHRGKGYHVTFLWLPRALTYQGTPSHGGGKILISLIGLLAAALPWCIVVQTQIYYTEDTVGPKWKRDAPKKEKPVLCL